MDEKRLAGVRKHKSISERFWPKVEKTAECWLWRGALGRRGYGIIYSGPHGRRTMLKAHRVSYALAYGRIPEGLHVCHRCDTPACVRPEHLFAGSRSDNMRDAAAKGRIKTTGKARQTHCRAGHEFTTENTMPDKHGHRRCRACHVGRYPAANAQARARRAAIRALPDEPSPEGT